MKIAVVGLGYVGLPLAVEFGKKFHTVGFDSSEYKIDSYRNFIDPSGELDDSELREAKYLTYHTNPDVLQDVDFIIIAVPTPVDVANNPDFSPLISATNVVAKNMKKGVTIIYESTVYPGATEEVCAPILESASGMSWGFDFNIGYSPERVNPGDKKLTLTKIVKVVAGDNPNTLNKIAELYSSIIIAGVHRVSSIKVAEASKVIENTQRDLNIALMNELAIIFNKIGIDTLEVLEAAGTKWNFLPFRPGLVGGHCIGVDPYYLTHKAEMLHYHPEVILAGRRINDEMPSYVAQQTIKQLINAQVNIKGARVNILGLTFKENCSDLRNSKVVNLVLELQEYGCDISIHDPLVKLDDAKKEFGLTLSEWDDLPVADAIVAAVSHQTYLSMPVNKLLSKLKSGGVFIDVKSVYDRVKIEKLGFNLWRL